MFNEVSKDFGISTKRVMQTMLEIDHVPALGTAEYVGRLSKQLGLDDFVRYTAIDLVGENI